MFFESVYKSWKPKQFAKYEHLSKQLDLKIFDGKKVLDIASGPCWFEEFLAKQKIDVSNFLCVDKSEKHLKEKNVAVKILAADASSLSLPGKFDAIVALDCLHLFDFDFRKYLKKNSFVLASLFFNKQNIEERRNFLKQKLKWLKIKKEIVIQEEPTYEKRLSVSESEIFILAKLS